MLVDKLKFILYDYLMTFQRRTIFACMDSRMKCGKLTYQLKKYLQSSPNLHSASTLPEMECKKKTGFLSLLSTVMPGYSLSPFSSVQNLVLIKLTGIHLSFLISMPSLLTIIVVSPVH